jgi:hypothetical protein
MIVSSKDVHYSLMRNTFPSILLSYLTLFELNEYFRTLNCILHSNDL